MKLQLGIDKLREREIHSNLALQMMEKADLRIVNNVVGLNTFFFLQECIYPFNSKDFCNQLLILLYFRY
jgi:hypothetical protein